MQYMEVFYLHGRPYIKASHKLKKFKEDPRYAHWRINTEVLENTETYAVVKASIIDHNGTVMATGHSREDVHTSEVTQTSFLECAETFAVGRALSFLGMGLEEMGPYEICSKEEYEVAKEKQKDTRKKKKAEKKKKEEEQETITTRQGTTLLHLAKDAGLTDDQDRLDFLEEFGVKDFDHIKKEDFERAKTLLEGEKKEYLAYKEKRKHKFKEDLTVTYDEEDF